MQTIQTFFLILKKQLLSIIIYFGIFLILTVLLSDNGEDSSALEFASKKVDFALIDYDNSSLSAALTSFMEETHHRISISSDKNVMAEELYYSTVEYILEIPKGFEEAYLKGSNEISITNYKSYDTNTDAFLNMQINQYLSILRGHLARGLSVAEATASTTETLKLETPVRIATISKDPKLENLYYYHLYIPYIFICILISGLAPVLIRFRETELLRRLNCAPYSQEKRGVLLIVASILSSLVCYLAFMILNIARYQKASLSKAGLLYLLNDFLFLFIAMLLTYLVSLFVKKQNSLSMISNVLGLGLSFLGGVFVPIEYFGKIQIMVAHFLPTYWYVKALNIIQDYSMTGAFSSKLYQNFLMEFLFISILLIAALVISKMTHKKGAAH